MGEQSRYGVLFRGASTLVGKQMKKPQLEYNSGKIPLFLFLLLSTYSSSFPHYLPSSLCTPPTPGPWR